MDLSAELRAAQRRLTDADKDVRCARAAERSASRAYDERRRYSPIGKQTDRARSAWALALIEWTTALVAREAARDRVKGERRDVDDTAMTALMGTERPLNYDTNDDPPEGA